MIRKDRMWRFAVAFWVVEAFLPAIVAFSTANLIRGVYDSDDILMDSDIAD